MTLFFKFNLKVKLKTQVAIFNETIIKRVYFCYVTSCTTVVSWQLADHASGGDTVLLYQQTTTSLR